MWHNARRQGIFTSFEVKRGMVPSRLDSEKSHKTDKSLPFRSLLILSG